MCECVFLVCVIESPGKDVEELYVKVGCVRALHVDLCVNDLRMKQLYVTRVLRGRDLDAKELRGNGSLTCGQTGSCPRLVMGKRRFWHHEQCCWTGNGRSATGARQMQVVASSHVASKQPSSTWRQQNVQDEVR